MQSGRVKRREWPQIIGWSFYKAKLEPSSQFSVYLSPSFK